MLGRELLRIVLLLWLARPTLQGGMGYGLSPQNANPYQPQTKGPVYGPAQPNRNEAMPNGPYKGYGAASAALGNGAKSSGYGASPASFKGNGGYGPAPAAANGQGAKANGGYGSKPNKPGYGAQPSYGIGVGMRTAAQQGAKSGGYGNGNGFGYMGSSFGGYRKGAAAFSQARTGLGRGYSNGAKAAKPGFGAGPAAPSAAKPNGYGQGTKAADYGPGFGVSNRQGPKPGYGGPAGGTKGPNPGYGGYPNAGGVKGPKPVLPGYGGLPTGYRPTPNGYGGYPNGGAKGPKPGYGGYPNGGAKEPKPGYGSLKNGNEKGLKGQNLKPEAASLPVTGYNKGVAQPVEPQPTVRRLTAMKPTRGVPSLPVSQLPQGKPSKHMVPEPVSVLPQAKSVPLAPFVPQGQVPQPEPAPYLPQGKGPKPGPSTPFVPQELSNLGGTPYVPQGKGPKPEPSAPFASQQELSNVAYTPYLPQGKGPKPGSSAPFESQQELSNVGYIPYVPQGKGPKSGPSAPFVPQQELSNRGSTPYLPQSKGLNPGLQAALVIPQGNPQNPLVPAQFPFAPQGKAPKPIHQVPQSVAPQVNGLNPTAPVLVPMLPQSKAPKPLDFSQMKGARPVVSEQAVPQTPGPAFALESNPTMLQMKGPVSAPGYGAGPWYPNNGGAKPYKPGTPQLPYNGAPIVHAGLDVTSPIEAQTAELTPEVKSAGGYGGQYGAQPVGSEGKPQVRYGIGGLHYGSSPVRYNSEPYGKYGPKAAGNYNPTPLVLSLDARSTGKYGLGGLLYGGQPVSPGSKTKSSGKYGQPAVPYAPEPVSLGGEAKSSKKYGNPAAPLETLGGVTDGRFISQPVMPYEALSSGPGVDGMKSVDQFGAAGYMKGGVQAEVMSYPAAAPTSGPSRVPTSSLEIPAHSQLAASTQSATPQQIHIQQHLKVQLNPQTKSWTGSNEGQPNLKGFLGNGYQG